MYACAHCRFWLADWALSQDSPRTQSGEQGAVCQPDAQMFPRKTGRTVLFRPVSFVVYFFDIIIKVASEMFDVMTNSSISDISS